MKIKIVLSLLFAILSATFITSCSVTNITGSGNLTTKTLEYSGFTSIDVQNGLEVDLTQSDTYSVEVTADDNIIEYIEISTPWEGYSLHIKAKPNTVFNNATALVTIKMPELNNVELSGGSSANITGFNSTGGMAIYLSGGSQIGTFITPGNITVRNIDFGLSGGSQVRLSGSASNLTIDCSGGSNIDLENFSVNNADVVLSGGSEAKINVTDTLDFNLSGGSELLYTGNPAMGDMDVTGDSNIIKK